MNRTASVDGVHVLRKRRRTRLWYRQLPESGRTVPRDASVAPTGPLSSAIEAAWAELLSEMPDEPAPAMPSPQPVAEPAPAEPVPPTRRLGQPGAPLAPTDQTAVLRPPVADEWRVVPDGAPSLLLAATELLDARKPGPVLRPGARYRVAGVQNGVVGLYVTDPDGDSGLGFCAAVDLICIDTRFTAVKAGRSFGAVANPFRSRMQRLTGGFYQARTARLT